MNGENNILKKFCGGIQVPEVRNVTATLNSLKKKSVLFLFGRSEVDCNVYF